MLDRSLSWPPPFVLSSPVASFPLCPTRPPPPVHMDSVLWVPLFVQHTYPPTHTLNLQQLPVSSCPSWLSSLFLALFVLLILPSFWLLLSPWFPQFAALKKKKACFFFSVNFPSPYLSSTSSSFYCCCIYLSVAFFPFAPLPILLCLFFFLSRPVSPT